MRTRNVHQRAACVALLLTAALVACGPSDTPAPAATTNPPDSLVLAAAEYVLRQWPEEMRHGAFIMNVYRDHPDPAPLDRVEAYDSVEHSAAVLHWLDSNGVRWCRIEAGEICADVVRTRPIRLVALSQPRSEDGRATSTVALSSSVDGRWLGTLYELQFERSEHGWMVTGRNMTSHEQ